MPHYHNFGWYYFAKYVLGLAGMIFLYTGFLKEKSVDCVCPAEERELNRRKERNNDTCPTGDPTDAPARTDLNARTPVDVDVENENAPITTNPTNHDENLATSENQLRPNCQTNCETNVKNKFTSITSFDETIDVPACEKHRSHCCRSYEHRRDRNERYCHCDKSPIDSKSTDCLELLRKKNNQNPDYLDELTIENLRRSKTFVEQENLELEAFVRSIVDGEISKKLPRKRGKIFSSTNSTSETNCTMEFEDSSENEEPQNSSNEESDNSSKYCPKHGIRTKSKCKKGFPRSPVMPVVESRLCTVYFEASSRGKKRSECKMHGRILHCGVPEQCERRKLHHCRNREETDVNNQKIENLRCSMEQRNITGRRINPYTDRR